MRRREIKPGDRFSMLTVIEEAPQRHSGRYIKCRCDCGEVKEILLHHLTRLATKSCGCHRTKTRTKHNMWTSREYSTWENMMQRCGNPKSRNYHNYGGRGIKVCDRWAKSFAAFYEDMGARPQKTSLDRIDPDKGYFKENCRWATTLEQFANLRRYSQVVKIGEVYKSTEEWIKVLGINRDLFRARLRRGLGIKGALLVYVDIITLDVNTRQLSIHHLEDFLRKTGLDKSKVIECLDSDHEEPYHGFLIRYITAFENWPEKYRSK